MIVQIIVDLDVKSGNQFTTLASTAAARQALSTNLADQVRGAFQGRVAGPLAGVGLGTTPQRPVALPGLSITVMSVTAVALEDK